LLPEKQGQTAEVPERFCGWERSVEGTEKSVPAFLREDCARIAETFLKEEPG